MKKRMRILKAAALTALLALSLIATSAGTLGAAPGDESGIQVQGKPQGVTWERGPAAQAKPQGVTWERAPVAQAKPRGVTWESAGVTWE